MAAWKRTRHALWALALIVVACNSKTRTPLSPTPSTLQWTDTPAIVLTATPRPLSAATTTLTATQDHTATPSPIPPTPTASFVFPSQTASPTATLVVTESVPGCLRPPDVYNRVVLSGETLNARTLWMLKQAAGLYQGPADLLRVTQGSYTSSEVSSFGTHDGGGAVDLSIRNPANPAEVLWDEVDAIVLALRRAGFAAWYRAPNDLSPGSPAHIHAIAIGDRDLSGAAVQQLIGPSGYFRGLDGLPTEYEGPHLDRHGGPIICQWMIQMGYQDLRD